MKKTAVEFTDESCKELALALGCLIEFQQHVYNASFFFDEAEKVSKTKDCQVYQNVKIQVALMLNQIQLKALDIEGLLSIREPERMIDRGRVILEAENYNAESTDKN